MMHQPLVSIIPEMADLFEMAKLSKKVDAIILIKLRL